MIFCAAENLFISFEVGFDLITVIKEIPHEFLSKRTKSLLHALVHRR